MVADVGLGNKLSQELPAGQVINNQTHDEQGLKVQPAAIEAKPEPQDKTKHHREDAQGCHESIKFVGHEDQSLTFSVTVCGYHGEIDKNPWQVKQACEPTHDEGDVKRFEVGEKIRIHAG